MHSFAGATRVLMADGSAKPIDQVRVGDTIANSVPGVSGTEAHKVTAVIVTHTDHDFVGVTIKGTVGAALKAGVKSLAKNAARKAAFGLAASAAILGALSIGHGHGQEPAAAPVAAATSTVPRQHTETAQRSDPTGGANDAHLTTTFHHPFYDETQSAFVKAKDLHAGDLFQTPTGTAEVTGVRLYHANTTTYDLTIGTLHTYYVEAGSVPILVHNANCSSNAKILGENLEASGVTRPADTAAHHIVASTSPKAASARQQLAKFGIDINDADNGVFLRRGSASSNPTGASVHSRIHTNDYYTYVNDMIGGARNANESRDVLDYLRRQLQGGYWP